MLSETDSFAHRQYVHTSCKTMFEEVFWYTNQSIVFLGNIEKLSFFQDKLQLF